MHKLQKGRFCHFIVFNALKLGIFIETENSLDKKDNYKSVGSSCLYDGDKGR